MGDLLCPHFIEYDSFHKYLCVKVGGLVLVAEAGKIFLTRAFLEEIFAVSNFDALESWGKHLCWAGEKCNIEAALLNVETIWSWKKKKNVEIIFITCTNYEFQFGGKGGKEIKFFFSL